MIKQKKGMKGEMNKRMGYGNEDLTQKLVKQYEFKEVLNPVGRLKKRENESG